MQKLIQVLVHKFQAYNFTIYTYVLILNFNSLIYK
jgi:hypothetical protein